MLDLVVRGGQVVSPAGVGMWDVGVEGGRCTTVDEATVAAEVTEDAAAFHARTAGARRLTAELAPYFRQMYDRSWQVDVGAHAFGPLDT